MPDINLSNEAYSVEVSDSDTIMYDFHRNNGTYDVTLQDNEITSFSKEYPVVNISTKEITNFKKISQPITVNLNTIQGVPSSTDLDTDRTTWSYLATTWTTAPTEVAYTGSDGVVLRYVYSSDTYYRFIPDTYNSSQDAFYSSFDGTTLSGLIATRGQ